MIGKTINDRYRLEAELGRGGMGTVYLAHDNVLERDAAVNLMPGNRFDPKVVRA